MSSKPKLVLVDTMGIIHRAYHAYPPLTTKDGELVNAVYGFGIMFMQILKNLKPEYLIFASDLKEKTFRSEKYADYKAQRGPMEEGLATQIEKVYDFIRATGLPLEMKEKYEADDIIGSLATKYCKDYDVHIVTGDKDLLQLIDDDEITVILPGKTFSDMREYHEREFVDRFGFSPKQYIDYKALVGDASDNIKGAKGIGEKTATNLIQEYHTLGGIYDNLDKIKEKNKKILEEYKEVLENNLDIVTIHKSLDIEIDKECANLKHFNVTNTVIFLKKYEFKSILTQFEKMDFKGVEIADIKTERKKIKFHKSDSESFPYFLILESNVSNSNDLFATEDNDTKFFLFDDKYNFKIAKEVSKKAMGFDTKQFYKITKFADKELYDDLQVMSYCSNPDFGDPDIFKLYKKYFHNEVEDDYELDIEEDLKIIAYKAIAFIEILKKVKEELDNREMKVYNEIDLPLVPVLAKMESLGMKVNVPYMARLEKIFQKKIEELKQKLYDCVGHEFNPNSPKELSVILFEELKLPKMKKTKTGYSTDERTIGKLSGTHPIIDLILEYREYTKLLSTYVVALQKVVDGDRIHTELRQTVVATGRLSSINPNLQNIPTRSETGELIRKAFIADTGHVLVSLDYSQIELRLMAEISGDKDFQKAFIGGKDIHTNTASLMFNIPESEVTSEQRRVAKMINFGIIYGISDFGLSDRLGGDIDLKTAKTFIEKYFERYPKIKEYFDKIKEQLDKDGYVETIFGRRRYFNMEGGNYMMKQAMFREAINMPIQGADADIVKKAMVLVQNLIEEKYDSKVKMLMQIHDELLFEVETKDHLVGKFVREATEIMENVVKFDVPMVVNAKVGANWGEMEKLKEEK